MSQLSPNVFTIPPAFGVALALIIIGLLVQKEIARTLGRPGWARTIGDPASVRRWRRAENWTIGLLFGLYGLIILARLLSFFP